MTKGRKWKITKEEAVRRVTAEHLDQVLHPQFASTDLTVIAKGLGASPGAAVGKVYFTADDAAAAADRGERVILVRTETSPEDVHGMIVAEGILTSRGGLVSHAAVVARGWGKPAVVGAESREDRRAQSFTVGGVTVNEGDVISIDGATGEVRSRRGASSARPSRRRSSRRSSGGPTQIRKGKRQGAGQRRHRCRRRPSPATSAPRASACAAPSTCSSARIGCPSCAA